MVDVAALVNELIAAGAEPSAAARIVTLAFVAGHASSDKTDSILERRRERDRVRKQQERALSKDIQGHDHNNELNKSETNASRPRTSVESVDGADIGSLSPIPLLSPTPPNNPLTPKPSLKSNSRASRLPDDWILTGPNLAYALSKGFAEPQIVSMHEAFCAWAWSASGKNAVKRSWDQAWRSWVLREKPSGNARAGPSRPATAYQQRRQETQEILDELGDFATGRSGSHETHSGFLSGHPGERPQELRGGIGSTVVHLPSSRGGASD